MSDDLQRDLGQALHAGLMDGARIVLAEAQRRAPDGDAEEQAESRRRYGRTLSESGSIDEHHEGGIIVSFDIPYAAKQHEDLRLKHTNGQAKFLESVVKEIVPTLEALVASHVVTRTAKGDYRAGKRI